MALLMASPTDQQIQFSTAIQMEFLMVYLMESTKAHSMASPTARDLGMVLCLARRSESQLHDP
jgi:hypothetical protein